MISHRRRFLAIKEAKLQSEQQDGESHKIPEIGNLSNLAFVQVFLPSLWIVCLRHLRLQLAISRLQDKISPIGCEPQIHQHRTLDYLLILLRLDSAESLPPAPASSEVEESATLVCSPQTQGTRPRKSYFILATTVEHTHVMDHSFDFSRDSRLLEEDAHNVLSAMQNSMWKGMPSCLLSLLLADNIP